MIRFLWLVLWVGELVFDSTNGVSPDYEVSMEGFSFDTQNFTDNLGRFALYDEREMDIKKAEARLRNIKVFKYTGDSTDFDEIKEKTLPLSEGASYCTMGRQSRIGCNDCICVAGDLYLCTGRVCSKPKTYINPFSAISAVNNEPQCTEGEQRKIDSCNYCYCRNGREYCSTRDCWLLSLRTQENSVKPCTDGQITYKGCNRCRCVAGEEYCTENECKEGLDETVDTDKIKRWGSCRNGDIHRSRCKFCSCSSRRWTCVYFPCHKTRRVYEKTCTEGAKRKLDACNYCYCKNGKEYCEKNVCNTQFIDSKFRDCKEGEYYRIDSCNFCFCYNGQDYCTHEVCSAADDNELYYHTSCEEGAVHQIDPCNYCVCADGEEICTTHECPDTGVFWDGTLRKKNSNEELTCKEGEIWYSICILCKCVKIHWQCIITPCFRRALGNDQVSGITRRQQKTCNGWEIKYQRCSRCECVGTQWICVATNCDESHVERSTVPLILNSKCNINGEKRRLHSCNTCICQNNQWVCENKNCGDFVIEDRGHPEFVKLLSELIDTSCVEGQKMKKDKCNDCFCFKKQWICENKQCVPDIVNKVSDAIDSSGKKICNVGDIVSTDCLQCGCFYKGWKCVTKPGCEDSQYLMIPLSNEEPTCIEGILRRPDVCNYCICINGEEFCTLNLCSDVKTEPECARDQIMIAPDTCNECLCFNSTIVCSKRPCPETAKTFNPSTVNDLIAALRKRQDVGECEVGRRGRRDMCNFCWCDYNRRYQCTNHKCTIKIGRRYGLERTASLVEGLPEKRCEEGVRWKIDACNYCSCRNGVEFCTQRMCEELRSLSLKGADCISGETLTDTDGCNKCVCLNSKIVCTKKRCKRDTESVLPINFPVKDCVDGVKRKIDNCNYCTCIRGQELCTLKYCEKVLTRPVNRSKPPACVPGQPIPDPDGCNTCTCVNTEILCTKISCAGRQSANTNKTYSKCKDGQKSSLNDGCNYCICKKGTNFCTGRACLVLDKRLGKTPCKKGDVTPSRDGCNVCLCVGGGKRVCTNRACTNKPWPVPKDKNLGRNILFALQKNTQLHKITRNIEECIEGNYYTTVTYGNGCQNDCVCEQGELLCTKRACLKVKSIKTLVLLKSDGCTDLQNIRYAFDGDGCSKCFCMHGRKHCTTRPACYRHAKNTASQTHYGLGSNNKQKEKKQTFCKPFTFFSPDKNRFCRNCFCLHNNLALCMLNFCKYSKDIPYNPELSILQSHCTPGEVGFPAKCVTCRCSEEGRWLCTREDLDICQERECDAKDEFQMGSQSFCAKCKCPAKKWYCEVQHNKCSDYSDAKCPLGKLIINPRQKSSICLCGGTTKSTYNVCFTEMKCVQKLAQKLL